jgi:hypothetical protein
VSWIAALPGIWDTPVSDLGPESRNFLTDTTCGFFIPLRKVSGITQLPSTFFPILYLVIIMLFHATYTTLASDSAIKNPQMKFNSSRNHINLLGQQDMQFIYLRFYEFAYLYLSLFLFIINLLIIFN